MSGAHLGAPGIPGQARPGEWLRKQRVAAGLTQEDLAERSGVSVRAIADLERGRTRRPYPSSVRALVQALGLPEEAGAGLVARYRSGGEGAGRYRAGAEGAGADGPAADDAETADGASGGGGGPAVPRQLPAGVANFAGRVAELAALDAVLNGAPAAAGGGTGVVISAIGGTAGVGKTALALHWAHKIAHRFPDGQLYANLRGFDAGVGQPADPADVLRGFLDAFGVHPERVPHDTESLAALYRSLLADRKMLVLLDNAADVAQVRPLLPASPECLVIVTSRRELSPLAAREGALLVQLDVLSAAEANELLIARLGAARAAAEPWAVTELATLCARLPLALSVIVARAAASPRLPLGALAAELTELGGRLDALDVGDPAANVRTVLSLSYRHLPEAAARMFRLLGLHPGPDISAAAAASLAGIPASEARVALRDLVRASLLNETAPGRYAFHDLLRAYAAEQSALTTSPAGVENTTRRLLDHYLHTAHHAHVVLYPGRELIALPSAAAGVAPETFGGKAAALAWLEAENQVLLKVVSLAAAAGCDAHAWQLPVVLWTYHNVCGHWYDGARLHRIALLAAERCGDLNGRAHALRGLGSFAMSVGAFEEAHDCLSHAQSTFAALGDDLGLARTDVILGQTLEYQRRFDEALSAMGDALVLSSGLPDDPNMTLVRASALNGAAWNNVQLGDLSTARTFCLQAIELCRSIGYSPGEAGTWDTLGVVWQRLSDHRAAVTCFLNAVTLDREMGNRYDLAMVLLHLGDTYASTGDGVGAREAWEESVMILEALHHPSAGEVRSRLTGLDVTIRSKTATS